MFSNEAAKCFSMSANQGNMYGQYDLGECYEKGHGVSLDIEEAKKMYKKAAENGLLIAQEALTRLQ